MDVMFSIQNGSFWYHPGKKIFEEVSFTVKKGEILCILGPNGIGKSTLLKCCAHINPLREGVIAIHNRPAPELSRKEIARTIGYVPQSHNIPFSFSVLQLVILGRTPHLPHFSRPGEKDRQIAILALQTVGIEHLKNAPVNRISGGECQLAMIARALTQEPDMLILDEPTSHLDFGNQVRILEVLEKLSSTEEMSIIMSTHYPDHALQLDCQVGIMQYGKISSIGSVGEMITEDNLCMAYGLPVSVHYIEKVGRSVCVPTTGCICQKKDLLLSPDDHHFS